MKSAWRPAAFLVGALMLAACGGQTAASNPTPTKTAIRWSQTAAPRGINVPGAEWYVPGAEWLKIEGAGVTRSNVQIAAVVRPQGPGPFPLVVWFHGGLGFHLLDVSKAARLTAGGFMVLVGCWQYTEAGASDYAGVSYTNIPCLQNRAVPVDAVHALIEVGHQLPGVKKDAIGLLGGSSSGPLVLDYVGTKTDIRAVVVDSSKCGPPEIFAPVLMLGGTADYTIPIARQRTCEQALRDSGGTVESHFYEGGGHGVTYFGDFQDDAMHRTIDFFKRFLG